MTTLPMMRPETMEEALSLLDRDGEALVYGGGTALQILRKQGILFASALVDISRLPGLDQLTETATGLRAGPMVSLRRMERDPLTLRHAPLAATAYSKVANPRVRNTASVGGNLAHGDYRLDPPVALLVLDATVELTGVRGTRRVPMPEFFVDFQQTALGPGEVVAAVEIPFSRPGTTTHFVKLSALSANDWPSATAAAGIVTDGTHRTLRLGLGALAATPVLTVLDITGLGEADAVVAAIDAAEAVMDPIPDIRGGIDYKRRLGRVAVEDAVRGAWKELSDA